MICFFANGGNNSLMLVEGKNDTYLARARRGGHSKVKRTFKAFINENEAKNRHVSKNVVRPFPPGHTELLVVLSQIEMSNNNLYIFEFLTPQGIAPRKN